MKNFYQQTIFPLFLGIFMRKESLMKARKELLADAAGKILEIGFGTGLNLFAYPADVKKITVVEVNPGMKPAAEKNIKNSDIKIDWIETSAESLPFDDNTFDTVVSTWTFCSIPDIDKALAEIYRVLGPGGSLLFVEHGLNRNKKIAFIQNKLAPVWKIFGEGCRLNRDIKKIVSKQPFLLKKYKEYSLPKMNFIISHTYQSTAEKPSSP